MPWALGLIATRSINGVVPGIDDLVSANEQRIKSGMVAYAAMETLRAHPGDAAARTQFDAHADDLGFALLLKHYTPKVTDAGEDQIASAALDTIPPVLPLFFTFRLMVCLRLLLHRPVRRDVRAGLAAHSSSATAGCCMCACGRCRCPGSPPNSAGSWPRCGRQPWTIDGVLPTFLSVSSVPAANVWISLIGFVLLYSVLAVVEVYLMLRAIRQGPEQAPPRPARGACRGRGIGRRSMSEYEFFRLLWWALLGVLLIGIAVMDGFDMGSAILLPFVARDRHRAADRHQHRRPGVGRQPGLADPRRRRHLRRLAGALCGGLLRLLPGDAVVAAAR